MRVEIERENDGRWIGEVSALPGVLAYGATADKARITTEALAFRVIVDRIEHGDPIPPEAREGSQSQPVANRTATRAETDAA